MKADLLGVTEIGGGNGVFLDLGQRLKITIILPEITWLWTSYYYDCDYDDYDELFGKQRAQNKNTRSTAQVDEFIASIVRLPTARKRNWRRSQISHDQKGMARLILLCEIYANTGRRGNGRHR